MNLFLGLCFVYILILGVVCGAEIRNQHPLESYEQHPSLRIINGKKVPIKKYPFMASLKVEGELYGSGVIIDKQWVLTTAFNVAWEKKSDLEFRVGSSKYSSGGQVLLIEDVIVHENYTGSWDYDIALVRVQPMKLGKLVKAIDLATKEPEGGLKGDVAGWGETDTKTIQYIPSEVLRAAEVTVLDWETCHKNYPELTPRIICTYDLTQGPCVYDYGDPLVADKVLYGLYAGGRDCTPGTIPVLYADVPAYHSWIKGKINSYLE